VVSARPGAIVTDAGVKSLAMDQRPPVFAAAPELSVNFSEEHSAVYGDVPAKKPGDIIRIIPGHCCTTVNLYDWIYLVRDGQVVDRLPVTGRGRSQ
jgi:D-serine deaminase-like pyridoxal phosphate-dependent protein